MAAREGDSGVDRWSTEGGVPVFALPSVRTPSAALMFRAGHADETLATSGWLHLLEHLAMHSSEHAGVRCNAAVGMCITEFSATGPEADVLRFMDELSAWLAEPSFDRLEHEVGIVQAEYARRGADDVAAHLGWRFGPRRHGLPAFHAFGVRSATPEGLTALADRHFIAGNAALALNFIPSRPLQLPLKPGEAVRPPQAEQLPLPAPAIAQGATPFIAASGLLRNNWSAPLVAETLRDITQHLLRRELGVSYATTSALERLDSETLILCLSSDVAPERRAESIPLLHKRLVQIAEEGVRSEDFARLRDQMLWSLDDDPTGGWLASISAIEHLYGSSLRAASELRGRLEALTETDLDDAVRAFLASVLYTAPTPEECSSVFPRVERASPPPKGKLKAFEPWNPMVKARLSISPYTAVFEEVPETRIALSLEDAAGLLKHPGGSRIVVGSDGATLHVDPATWLHGDQAVALLDQHIPAEKHIGLEADQTAVPFEQRTWARRRARAFASLALDPYVVLVVLLVTFPLVLLLALTTRLGPPAFTVWLLLGARCVFELTRSDR